MGSAGATAIGANGKAAKTPVDVDGGSMFWMGLIIF